MFPVGDNYVLNRLRILDEATGQEITIMHSDRTRLINNVDEYRKLFAQMINPVIYYTYGIGKEHIGLENFHVLENRHYFNTPVNERRKIIIEALGLDPKASNEEIFASVRKFCPNFFLILNSCFSMIARVLDLFDISIFISLKKKSQNGITY